MNLDFKLYTVDGDVYTRDYTVILPISQMTEYNTHFKFYGWKFSNDDSRRHIIDEQFGWHHIDKVDEEDEVYFYTYDEDFYRYISTMEGQAYRMIRSIFAENVKI